MARIRVCPTAGMLTAALLLAPASARAADYPSGLASHYTLEVVDWSATFKLPHEITVTVAVRMIPEPPAQSIVALAGNIRFHYPNGGGTGKFTIADPKRPVTTETPYVYRRMLDADSNTLPIIKLPTKDIQAFACVSTWTYDNGDTWIAN